MQPEFISNNLSLENSVENSIPNSSKSVGTKHNVRKNKIKDIKHRVLSKEELNQEQVVESLHNMYDISQADYDFVTDGFGFEEDLVPASSPAGMKKAIRPLFERDMNVKYVSRPSLLSSDNEKIKTYDGFLNLAVIVLVVSHFRLILENVYKKGLLMNILRKIPQFLHTDATLTDILLLSSMSFFGLIIYAVEAYCATRVVKELKANNNRPITVNNDNDFGSILRLENVVYWGQVVLLTALFSSTTIIVWTQNLHPISGITMMMLMLILFMKLWSYVKINDHLRHQYFHKQSTSSNSNSSINASYGNNNNNNNSNNNNSNNNNNIANLQHAPLHHIQQVEKLTIETGSSSSSSSSSSSKMNHVVKYPDNINMKDFLYFLCTPVLVYSENFPRMDKIRWNFLLDFVGRFLLCLVVMDFMMEQFMFPYTEISVKSLKQKHDLVGILEKFLRLAVPNIALWLLMFYTVFHLFLNILAELLKFGDRLFYLDWWNATSMDFFWRAWNLPVHSWLLQHIYLPLTTRGVSQAVASFTVFFISALAHEIIISVPLHTVKFWAFTAMMAQMPICYFTKLYTKGHVIGNLFFWCSFMFGQATIILGQIYDTENLIIGNNNNNNNNNMK